MNAAVAQRLASVIAERNSRRGLSLTPEKLAYSRDCVRDVLERHGDNVLYVGVGHGLDVLSDLGDGAVKRAVGVDPYIDGHGNGDREFQELSALIGEFGLGERFALHRTTVQAFLDENEDAFSAVVCFDVLHHIFVTRDSLARSVLAVDALALFRALRRSMRRGGVLIVSETERHGLRQLLCAAGALPSTVNYATKQNFGQWRALMEQADFRLTERRVYIPWALRGLRPVLDNALGLYTVSDRSIAVYAAV